ncbi:hypothetical protein AVEN_220743-1 [Araneus ventricosus]|uniref:Uncharacterized protein n=1 Tax=Araneus ventricosus TaxID=182803 RepID=A0A4Y2M9B2_ARAVE|nr:hypothetical protein AVEN_220743-1 [Araneus ventricosus]
MINIVFFEYEQKRPFSVTRNTDVPSSLPFPKRFLKQLLQLSFSRWQEKAGWDNGDSGRSVLQHYTENIKGKQLHWSRECIEYATGHGPFPPTPQGIQSGSHSQTTADVEK